MFSSAPFSFYCDGRVDDSFPQSLRRECGKTSAAHHTMSTPKKLTERSEKIVESSRTGALLRSVWARLSVASRVFRHSRAQEPSCGASLVRGAAEERVPRYRCVVVVVVLSCCMAHMCSALSPRRVADASPHERGNRSSRRIGAPRPPTARPSPLHRSVCRRRS